MHSNSREPFADEPPNRCDSVAQESRQTLPKRAREYTHANAVNGGAAIHACSNVVAKTLGESWKQERQDVWAFGLQSKARIRTGVDHSMIEGFVDGMK